MLDAPPLAPSSLLLDTFVVKRLVIQSKSSARLAYNPTAINTEFFKDRFCSAIPLISAGIFLGSLCR